MCDIRPVLALDIGGTKLAVGIVDGTGSVSGFLVEPTEAQRGPDDVIARLFRLAHRALKQAECPSIAAVGIGCGGPLDSGSGILSAPLHLPGWCNIPIADLAAAEFSTTAVLQNDASAAALGEFRYGAARGSETALYLTISTGIGGGAVINGRLHRGAAGNGGEFGHLMVRPGGRLCLCGRRGCLEAYASGSSIAARAREAVAVGGAQSGLAELGNIRAEDVAALARFDALASAIWGETVDVLAQAITDLVNVFEPDIVVLGGGVTGAGELLIAPIRAAVRRDAMGPAVRAVRIELSQLGERVGVYGAAAVAFDHLAETERIVHK